MCVVITEGTPNIAIHSVRIVLAIVVAVISLIAIAAGQRVNLFMIVRIDYILENKVKVLQYQRVCS